MINNDYKRGAHEVLLQLEDVIDQLLDWEPQEPKTDIREAYEHIADDIRWHINRLKKNIGGTEN